MHCAADQIDQTSPTSPPTTLIGRRVELNNTDKKPLPFSSCSTVTTSSDLAQFAQLVYLQMVDADPSSNFIFSPASMYAALTTVLMGTTEDSATMLNMLHSIGFGAIAEPWIKCKYETVITLFESQNNFKHGNKLWVQNEKTRWTSSQALGRRSRARRFPTWIFTIRKTAST